MRMLALQLQECGWKVGGTRKSVRGAGIAQEAFYASKTVSSLQAEGSLIENFDKEALLSQS